MRSGLVVATLALVVLLGTGGSASARTSSAPMPRFVWGAWIGDQFTGQQPPWDWNAVKAFESRNAGGRHISVLHWGIGTAWDHEFNYWRGAFNLAQDQGVLSVVDMATGSVPLRSIANGAKDGVLQEWATQAAAWGQPFLLRFDWEMNGAWYPWSTRAEVGANTDADFVAAWRHVHQIFVNAGATNVSWVWCPNIAPEKSRAAWARLYPGNNYVDWTCLDGYNWDTPWRSFTKIYGTSYKRITRMAPTKPMMIGEIASTEHGGSKANWISGMFQAMSRMTKIRGLVWYDVYDRARHKDWPIETSKASSTAFKNGLSSTLARVCRPLSGNAKAQCLGK
jgi:hypothetical protein